MNKYTAEQVWGFSDILTVEADIATFLRAMNLSATSRAIAPNVPSDALDLSRDLILDEAAQTVGANWELDGTTLRLWRADLTVKWDAVAEVAGR